MVRRKSAFGERAPLRAGRDPPPPAGRNKEIVMGAAGFVRTGIAVATCLATLAAATAAPANGNAPNLFVFADPSGSVRTFNTRGAIDVGNLFFQSLGTNGRSCG